MPLCRTIITVKHELSVSCLSSHSAHYRYGRFVWLTSVSTLVAIWTQLPGKFVIQWLQMANEIQCTHTSRAAAQHKYTDLHW